MYRINCSLLKPVAVLLLLISNLRFYTKDKVKEDQNITHKDEQPINIDHSSPARNVADLFIATSEYSHNTMLQESTRKFNRRSPLLVFGYLGNCIKLPFRRLERPSEGRKKKMHKDSASFQEEKAQVAARVKLPREQDQPTKPVLHPEAR